MSRNGCVILNILSSLNSTSCGGEEYVAMSCEGKEYVACIVGLGIVEEYLLREGTNGVRVKIVTLMMDNEGGKF